MAILNKDDFMKRIKEKVGDDTSDEALAFMEDMTDTFNDLESKSTSNGTEDWKAKYNELDKSWREKYKARFFDSETTPPEEPKGASSPEDDKRTKEEERAKEVDYDDLFTEKENK